MIFLNPWLLLMLPGAIVPLFLHLWMSRRVRVVDLSTFRFLFDSYVQQQRRLKFLEALIATLRTMFILILVAVAARPAIKHWSGLFGSGIGRDVVLLVDCSASMSAHTDGVSSLDRAKAAAHAIHKHMGGDDRLSLVRVGSEPEEVFNRFNLEAEQINQDIEQLETSSEAADLFNTLRFVANRAAGPATTAVFLYFLTDCQESGFRDLRDQNLAQLLPENAQLTVVDVGSGRTAPNSAVTGILPSNSQLVAGLPVILRPEVTNYSAAKVSDVPLSVFIEEKEIARMQLTLEPGQEVEHEVVYVPTRAGVLKGRFEIPIDRFPDDDTYLFTLRVVPRLRILLVRPDPADPADTLHDEALYLRTALAAESGETPDPAAAPSPVDASSLDVKEIAEPALNADRIRDMNLVILANCGALSAEQCVLLREYVFKGGGLLIFPGEHVNAPAYNDQLFGASGAPDTRLTCAKFGDVKGDPENAETFVQLSDIDFGHPVMSVFRDPGAQFFQSVRFFRRYLIDVEEDAGKKWTIAHFSDGAPALLESRFGEGRTVVASFPANTRWSNLPLKPEFVPLVLQLVGHLASASELDGPSAITAGATARITVDPEWAPVRGKVIDRIGHENRLDFQWSGAQLCGAIEGAKKKGYYDVEIAGRASGEDARKGTVSFAVNTAPEESDFNTVGENQLRGWLHSDALTVVDASAQVQHLKGSIGDEREIWRPLIYLTLLIIGCEFLLSTSSGHKRTRGERLSLAHRVRQLSPAKWIGEMTGGAEQTE